MSSFAVISIGRSWIGSVKHSGDGERSLSSRSAGASRSSRSRSFGAASKVLKSGWSGSIGSYGSISPLKSSGGVSIGFCGLRGPLRSGG